MNKQKLTKEQKKEIWIAIGIWGAALFSVAVLESVIWFLGFDKGCEITAKGNIDFIKSTSPEAYNLILEALDKNKQKGAN